MYALIVFLPLFSSSSLLFFGFRLGVNGAVVVNTSGLASSAFLTYHAFVTLGLTETPQHLQSGAWVESGLFNANWSLYLDSVTSVMFLLITTASTLIYLYSVSYLLQDPHFVRFSAYISLFVFGMLALVSAADLIQLFFGWESIGIASYLLIGFWYTRISANKAAVQAILVNNVGDVSSLFAFASLFAAFQSVDFSTIFCSAPLFNSQTVVLLGMPSSFLYSGGLFLLLGAVSKSAQLGLHTWSPNAMEGPTPVSALIHAATLVTSGVFLLVRCSPLFEQVDSLLVLITLLGATTAFFAATIGVLQQDLNKVIAYSTMSQMAYCVFACGLSHYQVALFHVFCHGFFNALLFLSAGAVIHGSSDEQDIRNMGGLAKILPVSYTSISVGSLSLIGFPFLSGFYSNDSVLEVAAASYSVSGTYAYWLGLGGAFCTAFYSFRLIYFVFWSGVNGSKAVSQSAHEGGRSLLLPLIPLAVGSLFFGYSLKDSLIGPGSPFLSPGVHVSPLRYCLLDAEFLPAGVNLLPLWFTVGGAVLSVLLYTFFAAAAVDSQLSSLGSHSSRFIGQKWYLDVLINRSFVSPVLRWGYSVSFRLLDNGWIEWAGPQGFAHVFYTSSQRLSRLHSGLIHHSASVLFLGVICSFHMVVGPWSLFLVEHNLYALLAVLISFFRLRF